MLRFGFPSAAVLSVWVALATTGAARAGPCDSLPRLHPGAIEIGVAGSASSTEGVTQGEIGLRAGSFFQVHGALFAAALEPSFTHVEGLDLLDVEGSISWAHRARSSPVYGFLAAAAGVRQEWIGSFDEARYPVGFGVGLWLLASPTAGVRIEYRYRRVLHDPVADFSEQGLLAGVSLFLRNRSTPATKSPER